MKKVIVDGAALYRAAVKIGRALNLNRPATIDYHHLFNVWEGGDHTIVITKPRRAEEDERFQAFVEMLRRSASTRVIPVDYRKAEVGGGTSTLAPFLAYLIGAADDEEEIVVVSDDYLLSEIVNPNGVASLSLAFFWAASEEYHWRMEEGVTLVDLADKFPDLIKEARE